MATLEPFAASTAVEIAVNGGATTMSQCFTFETSGRKEEKNVRVSASVLYIFQLPAITRRRMTRPPRIRRTGRKACPTRAKEFVYSFVGESFDAGEFASAEKLEGSAASGRDMGNLVGNTGLVDGGNRIAASDDGSCAGARGSGDRNFHRRRRR